MGLLGLGERLEPLGNLGEALVPGALGEARVHLAVLVGLALDGSFQVLVGLADREPGRGIADLGEEVEVAERVTGFGLRGVAEEAADVGVALDVGPAREVEVPAVRLRLARERVLQIVVSLGSLEIGHARTSPFRFQVTDCRPLSRIVRDRNVLPTPEGRARLPSDFRPPRAIRAAVSA